MGKPSFTTLQSVVALVAGLSSIVGAAYSAVGTFRATPPPGEILVDVRDAASGEPVHAATVEVFTRDGTLITTARCGAAGVTHAGVAPGTYRVRIAHVDFTEAMRDVQVAPDATATVSVALARPQKTPARATSSHGSEPRRAANVIDRGVVVGRRLLGRIGF